MSVIDSLIDVVPLYLEGFGLTILLLLVSGVGAFILGVIIVLYPTAYPTTAGTAAAVFHLHHL